MNFRWVAVVFRVFGNHCFLKWLVFQNGFCRNYITYMRQNEFLLVTCTFWLR